MIDINTPLAELVLPVRISRNFQLLGAKTLADMLVIDDTTLLRAPNFGRKSLNEWKNIKSQYGIKYPEPVIDIGENIRALETRISRMELLFLLMRRDLDIALKQLARNLG